MSRIGNRIISVPAGVNVQLTPSLISTSGPNGKINLPLAAHVQKVLRFKFENNTLVVTRTNEAKQTKMLHGTYNALLKNAVEGVAHGFSRELQLVGVGYRAALKGNHLALSLGYSHPVELLIPAGIKVAVEKNTNIKITGADKQLVGEFAVQVRK